MATLDYHDGFEHGLVGTANAGPYDSVAGTAAIVTTPVRTGSRALEISASAAAENVAHTVAATVVTSAFYIRFATLPTSAVRVAVFLNATSGNAHLDFLSASGKLATAIAAGTPVEGGPVLATNTWYRVVVEYDTSTATASLKARVDGGTEFSATASVTSGNTTSLRLGTDIAATYTGYYDDWLTSVTDGDYEEISGTWTAHSVEGLRPSSDGTHNTVAGNTFEYSATGTDITDASTDVNTLLDEAPLSSALTDYVNQVGNATTGYVEVLFADLAAGTDTPVAVRGYEYDRDSTGTGTTPALSRVLLSDDTAVTPDLRVTTDDPGTTMTLRKKLLDAPTGGWDRTKVNGLKARLGFGDAAPDAQFESIMLEVALAPAAADQTLTGVLFAKAPTFPAGRVDLVLTGTTFTKAPTFPAGQLNLNMAGVLFTKAPTFPVGSIAAEGGAQTLTGVLFTRTPAFPAGRLDLRLAGLTFTKAPTFPQGRLDLHLGGVAFVRAPTFPQGALRNTQILTGVTFTKAPWFPLGSVQLEGGPQTLTGIVFTRAPAFPQGALAGTQILSGLLFARAPTFPIGLVTSGTLGKPVADPQAVLTDTPGQAVLTAVSGDAILHPVDG